MTTFKKLALTAMAVGAVAAATPAMAVVTTFASFNATNNGNIAWLNGGTGGNNQNYRSNGLGGTMFTTNSAQSVRPAQAVPGAIDVKFSFLSPLSPTLTSQVTDVNAKFTFSATSALAAQSMFGITAQQGLSGSFSFISTSAITVGSTTYAAGSNLLSGTFSSGAIAGLSNSTSGGASAATTSGGPLSVVYTSDFLSFVPTVDRDFSLSLTAITSLVANINRGLNYAGSTTPTLTDDKGLRSFRATATGSFSTDPAPLVLGVPEPAVWGMMIAGFGVVGFQSRRRRAVKSVTA